MDPISALGVAAAAVQFLDFSLQALHLCRQIRDDAQGATALNAQLGTFAKGIRDTSQTLQSQHVNTTACGRHLTQVARKCIATSEELLTVLGDVQRVGKASFVNDARALFRVMKGRRTIEKLHNALKSHQLDLEVAVTLDLR